MSTELIERETPTAPTIPPVEAAAVLRVDGLHVSVGGGSAEAVRDVSFAIRPGEAVGLVGESGSGKSLTCRSVLGVLPAGCAVSAGRVELGGTELTGLGKREWTGLRGQRLGAVFQDPGSYLNPSLTVGRQLAEQLRLKRGLSRAAARAEALSLLSAMGLHRVETVYRQYPHELSGGMLQRVGIAIAVAGEPELLVADEATTALDVAVQAEVLELLRGLREEGGLALLLVSHDLAVVAEVCDRVVVLYAGEVVEEGRTGAALLAVSSLTFLGIGVKPPAPTWGGVLASELGFLAQQPWAPVIPAALIMATVAALNALADGVRDSGVTSALRPTTLDGAR